MYTARTRPPSSCIVSPVEFLHKTLFFLPRDAIREVFFSVRRVSFLPRVSEKIELRF